MPLHQIFFYLTLILLPTQLGFHFWPDWAMVLGRRLDYLSPTIFLTDITILLTILFWFITCIQKCHSEAKPKNLKEMRSFTTFRITIKNILRAKREVLYTLQNSSHFVRTIIIVVIIFVSCNILLAVSPIIAFSKWLKIFEFVLFGFYIIKTKPSLSRALWCLSFAVLYSSVIAITQFLLQHSIGGLLWFLGERTFDITTPGIARIQFVLPSVFRFPSSELLRPYATFPHPNVLGGFLAITLPLIFYQSANLLIYKSTNKFKKIFVCTTLFLGLIAIILTFSRSAWVAFIVLFLIFKFKNLELFRNWKLEIRNLLSLVGLLALIGFFLLPYFQTLTVDSESVFVRNELNTAALTMVIPSVYKLSTINYERLFFGFGLGNFLVELPKIYPHRDIFFLQPVHNIYLLVLSETGIVGLGLFIFLIIYIVWTTEDRRQKTEKNRRIFPSSVIRLPLFILLLLGLVDHYPLTLQQGQLLFTVILSMAFIGAR